MSTNEEGIMETDSSFRRSPRLSSKPLLREGRNGNVAPTGKYSPSPSKPLLWGRGGMETSHRESSSGLQPSFVKTLPSGGEEWKRMGT